MSEPDSESPDGPSSAASSAADKEAANSSPAASSPVSGAHLSIDQLSQAFAQLMGEQECGASSASAASSSSATDDSAQGDGDIAEDAAVANGQTAKTSLATATVRDEDEEEIEGRVTPESIVEAMLFVGHPENRPLTSRTIASFLRGVSPEEVDAMVEDLNRAYREQNAPYEIIHAQGGYHMGLREEYHRLRDVFLGRVREARLNQAAIDLLAIVAYQQPITQDRIEALRGQPSGGPLAQLVRRQLLQVEYTRDKPRKKVYRTTERFLDLMGIQSLDDLPSHEDF